MIYFRLPPPHESSCEFLPLSSTHCPLRRSSDCNDKDALQFEILFESSMIYSVPSPSHLERSCLLSINLSLHHRYGHQRSSSAHRLTHTLKWRRQLRTQSKKTTVGMMKNWRKERPLLLPSWAGECARARSSVTYVGLLFGCLVNPSPSLSGAPSVP